MKRVIVIACCVVLLLMVFTLMFRNEETGYVVSSGSSGSSGGLGSSWTSDPETSVAAQPARGAGAACKQAPFDRDPNSFACGKGCCFSTQACYEGQVCCDRATETGDHMPPGIVYFCKKTCDPNKGQSECGDICCNLEETCKKQGMFGKYHGTCLKPEQVQTGCTIEKGETPCMNEDGELFECCAANQECKSKKIGLLFKVTLWGCSVKENKGGGCGTDALCQGTGKDFKGYAVCCKNPGEICALHPGGQPYCYPMMAKQLPTEKKTFGLIDWMRAFIGWS